MPRVKSNKGSYVRKRKGRKNKRQLDYAMSRMNKKRALRSLGRALRPYVQPGPVTLAKKRSGVRSYIDESRGNELTSAQDTFEWRVIGSHGCYGTYNNILSASGQDGALGSASDLARDYHVYNLKVNYHFRNVSNHDCFMYVYECVIRSDYNIDSTTNTDTACATYAAEILNEGWEKLAASGEFGASGTIASHAAGSTSISSNVKFLSPYKSKNFTEAFKIMKTSRIKLKPGDDYWYSLRVKAHDYQGSEWLRGDLERREAVGGTTKVMLIGLHGALGKANSSDSKTGWMTTDVAFEKITKAKVCQLTTNDDSLGVSYTADDLTALTLEGPTEHSMVDENQ